MTNQRLKAVAIAGTLGVAAAGFGLVVAGKFATRRPEAGASADAAGGDAPAAKSQLATLAAAIGSGDANALMTLCGVVTPKPDQPETAALTTAEGDDYLAVLRGLRSGYRTFSPTGKASAISAAGLILNRFRVDPAPGTWLDALHPTHDLFNAGLADTQIDARCSALNEVGSHWNFLPGRPMTPAEETTLAEWKDSFVPTATRCLGDREPKSRAAAVACLGLAPVDSVAAPAAAYVEDPDNGGVRYKALLVFAARPNLLSEDAVLKRLHDKEPGISGLAEIVLKGRGLTKEQIYLGRQMDDPRPEVRAAVIPVIRERTDIDPTVWLIQLSRDADETVRGKAAEALASRESPEVDRRLQEMASSDTSPAVRATVAKLVARLVKETTAALPSLPATTTTTSSMRLRAN